ncbi:MAG: hypothetical protein QM811_23235 [Pirellulales bacterium]
MRLAVDGLSVRPLDNGQLDLTLTLTDELGASGSGMISIATANVAPTVMFPTIPNGAEGTAISFVVTVTDPANPPGGTVRDPLTYAWTVTGPNGYTTSGTTTTVQFTPPDNGNYLVSFTADDGDQGVTNATTTVTVLNVAPTVTIPVVAPGLEGTPISLTVTVTDPANPQGGAINDPLTYAWTVVRSDGTVIASGTTLNVAFTPPDNDTYTLTFTADDGDPNGVTTATREIVVNNVAPTVVIPPGANGFEGTPISLTVAVTDPANPPGGTINDPLTYTWRVENATGTIIANGTTTNVTFTPPDNGTYTLTFTANDGDSGGVTTATRVYTIANVAPTVTIPEVAPGLEGTPISLTVTVTDPANPQGGTINDPLTYAWTVTRTDGTFVASGTTLNVAFTPPDNDTYTLTFTADDGDPGGITTATRDILVRNVAPTVVIPPGNSGFEGTPISVTVSVTDPANPSGGTINDPLTYAWRVENAAGTIIANGTTTNVTFTPPDNGTYTLTFTADDGDPGGVTTASRIYTIANVAPTVIIPDVAPGVEGTPISLTVTVTDPANPLGGTINDPLTYAWTVSRSNGSIVASGTTPNVTFTPPDNDTYTLTFTANDGDPGGVTTATREILVRNVAPTVLIPEVTPGVEGTAISLTVAVTDPANPPGGTINDPLTYAWSVKRSDGTIVATGSTLNVTFTPPDNDTYTLTFTANDGDPGGITTATRDILVRNVAPTVIIPAVAPGFEGMPISLTVTVTDPANPPGGVVNDPLTYAWSVTRSDGTLIASGATLDVTFTPPDNDVYTLTFTADDGDPGGVTTATRDIPARNVAPTVLIPVVAPGREGTAVSLTVAVTDPANPVGGTINDPLTYVWKVERPDGTLLASGTTLDVTFLPPDDGTYLLTFTANDGDPDGITTVTREIAVMNVAPMVTVVGPTTGLEGTAITVTGDSTDPANTPTGGVNDPQSYTWVVTKDEVFYASGVGTKVDFTPNNQGRYVVAFTADDGDGGVTTAFKTIEVANVAPTPFVTATDINGQFFSTVNVTVTDPGNDGIQVRYVWGDLLPNDLRFDPFLPGESALDPRVLPPTTHRYLVALNLRDPLAPVTINIIVFDGTDVTVTQVTVQVTEQGIPFGGVYITPEVPEIEAIIPPPIVVQPPTLTVPSLLTQRNDLDGGGGESQNDEDQRLILTVVDENGVETPAATLPDDGLADLSKLFAKLPDGHYRVYLQRETTRRLVIDTFVIRGRAVDPAELDRDVQDRPPAVKPAAPATTEKTTSYDVPADAPATATSWEPELSERAKAIARRFLPLPVSSDAGTTSENDDPALDPSVAESAPVAALTTGVGLAVAFPSLRSFGRVAAAKARRSLRPDESERKILSRRSPSAIDPTFKQNKSIVERPRDEERLRNAGRSAEFRRPRVSMLCPACQVELPLEAAEACACPACRYDLTRDDMERWLNDLRTDAPDDGDFDVDDPAEADVLRTIQRTLDSAAFARPDEDDFDLGGDAPLSMLAAADANQRTLDPAAFQPRSDEASAEDPKKTAAIEATLLIPPKLSDALADQQATLDSATLQAIAFAPADDEGTFDERRVRATYESGDLSESQGAAVAGLWRGTVTPSTTPRMTIKRDGRSESPRDSRLVIKTKALSDNPNPNVPLRNGADYELLNVIGEGGVGVVYAARQASIDRTVAIKMLKPSRPKAPSNARNSSAKRSSPPISIIPTSFPFTNWGPTNPARCSTA